MFPTFESFAQLMDQTENYECLVINNNAKSNKLQDQILHKAENHPDFKLGWKEFYDPQNIDSDDDEEMAIRQKGVKK